MVQLASEGIIKCPCFQNSISNSNFQNIFSNSVKRQRLATLISFFLSCAITTTTTTTATATATATATTTNNNNTPGLYQER